MGGAEAEAGAGIAHGDIHIGVEAKAASLSDEIAMVLGAARQAAVRGVQLRATAATGAEEREQAEGGMAVHEAKELYTEYVALRFRLFAREDPPYAKLPLLPPPAVEFFGALLLEWDRASFAATSTTHMEDGCGAEAGGGSCAAQPVTPQHEDRARQTSLSPWSSVSPSEQLGTSMLRTEVAALRKTRNAAERGLARLGRSEARCAGELEALRAHFEEAEAVRQQQAMARGALEEAETAIVHAREDRIARDALISRLEDEARVEAAAAQRMRGAGSHVEEEEETSSEYREVEASLGCEEQAVAQLAEALAAPRQPPPPPVPVRARDLAAATPAAGVATAVAAPVDTAALKVEVAGLSGLCERLAQALASAYQVRDQLTSQSAGWCHKAGVAVSELREAESMLTSLRQENSKLRLELGNLGGRHIALAPAEGQPSVAGGTAVASSQACRRPSPQPAPAPVQQLASILQTPCNVLPRGRVVRRSAVPTGADAGGGGGTGAAATASPAASLVVAAAARTRPVGGSVTPRAAQQPPPGAALATRFSAGEGGLGEAQLQSRRGRVPAVLGKGASGVRTATSSDRQRSLSVGRGSAESPRWRP